MKTILELNGLGDDELNELARALVGWKRCQVPDQSFSDPSKQVMKSGWETPAGLKTIHQRPPNYVDSLDACSEFEKTAPMEYWRQLANLTDLWDRVEQEFKYVQNLGASADIECAMTWVLGLAEAVGKATPRQRTIAFILTKSN